MESFFIAVGVVALAEIGDKTQLLSLLLAARFQRPWPIILGIFTATLGNHLLAGLAGRALTTLLGPEILRWILGVSFLAMAIWMLVPDKLQENEAKSPARFGVFGTTVAIFFLAEMGDKTQVATVALAARFDNLAAIVTGTTVGMMLANIPAVLLGDKMAARLPARLLHGVAAVIFALLGGYALLGNALPGL
ncbi:MAG: TMEM165/GDT1 family protein [Zoogloeaceae bacterium]|jgi:putative Ca2+/H+ antiporter (TMEM165/GDT1 family)|nr:TMEM165/GDT1 family protein [Zoogloeaceae bacterium]